MVTKRDTQRPAQPQGQGKPQQLMRPAKRQLLNENSLPIPPIPPTVVPPPAVLSQRSQPTSKNDLPYPPHVPPLNAEGNPMGHLVPNVAAAEPSMLRDRYNSNNPYVVEAKRLAKEYGLPENIFLALIHQESRFDANALSPAGAIGLTQLMPGTASDMGVDPRDPMQNLEGGARYLAQQYKAFGEWPLALAAYNAGPSRVRKAGNVIPDNKETQNYVPTVLHNAGVAGYADGGLIELARKYADGGSVSRAAQVYDPAVIAAIAASITEPQGYADGGTATGVSSDDAAPAQEQEQEQERVQDQRPRTFADLVRRYAVGDAMQMGAPLDDQSLGAGVPQSIGDYFRPIVQGNFEVPGTVKKYAIDVATGPKPFTRLGKDIGTFGSAIWEGVKNDPVGTALDFVPVVSNVRSAMDMHESRNRAVEAEQAGDEDRASMYRQFSALGAAGAIPLVGYGAIAARRAANAARDAAARRAGAGAGTALVVRGGVDDIDIGSGSGSGVGLIAREDAAAGARGTQAIAREGAEGVTAGVDAGTDVVAREGVGLEPSGSAARRAKAAARESAQAVAVVPRELSPLGFYSHGAETAANLAQAKGTPQQFRGMLEKYGVKPVELEGFDEAFANRPSVTREELAKHFSERRPQIEETVLGFNQNEVKAARERAESAGNNWDELGPVNQGRYIRSVSGRSLTDYGTDPKFQRYTLPGGENYREIALTLPGEEIYRVPDSHSMGEKADVNRIAHIRMSDRTGPNGEKILHLEELQSDWGQKGRTEGFAQKLDPKILDQLGEEQTSAMFRLEDARDAFNDYYESIFRENIKNGFKDAPTQYDLPNALKAHDDFIKSKHPQKKFDEYKSNFLRQADTFTPQQRGFLQDTYDTHFEAKNAYSAARDKIAEYYYSLSSGISSAPYVTNTAAWTDLALKRALKEAAEGGYDRIVWTPGAEQVKRWGLVDKPREGMMNYYDKMVPNQLGKLVKRLDPDAKVGMGRMPVRGRNVSGEDIARELGMTIDQINALPNAEKRALIGSVRNTISAPGLTITPKMREAIMKGQTDFAEGGHVQGYADGGSADNSLAALYEKYYGGPTTRISYAQGGSVDSAPVYDPAVIAAIAASITEDDHA